MTSVYFLKELSILAKWLGKQTDTLTEKSRRGIPRKWILSSRSAFHRERTARQMLESRDLLNISRLQASIL